MLRLSKKVEYALIAMNHIAMSPGEVISAHRIAEEYNISFEFLAKALQALVRAKLIYSQQGVHGGYVLARSAEQITVGEIIDAIEKKPTVVKCAAPSPESCKCSMYDRCTIKLPMQMLQDQLEMLFNTMTVAEMARMALQQHSHRLSQPISISILEGKYND